MPQALWNIESLDKSFANRVEKGIAAANHMPLKTRVVTKIAGVFQKVWVLKYESSLNHCQTDVVAKRTTVREVL